ncbi:MAG: hypothetical protein NTV49_16025 [Kiritimatiellaeota bacterium]|nr:hypothetical protein [Kiritimatiellota bacterium]
MSKSPSSSVAVKPASGPAVLLLLSGLFIMGTTLWPLYLLSLNDIREIIRFILTGKEFWPGGPFGWMLLAWAGLYLLVGVWLVVCGARGCLRLARHRVAAARPP